MNSRISFCVSLMLCVGGVSGVEFVDMVDFWKRERLGIEVLCWYGSCLVVI